MKHIQKNIEFGKHFLWQNDNDVKLWNLYVDVFIYMRVALFGVKTCSGVGGDKTK